MALPEISEQEMEFVQEYVKDRNGTRAALASGISPSYQVARQASSKLLTKADIKAWVRYLTRKQARALKFKPSKILRNWMIASQADLTCFEVIGDGKVRTTPGVPLEFIKAVRKSKQVTTTRTKGDETYTETRTEIELRDPFGPEQKLMEYYKELAGDDAQDTATDLMGQIAALLACKLAQRRGGGGVEDGAESTPAVDPEAGGAGTGLPE